MKKLILAAAAMLCAASAYAQFGLVGGVTSNATDVESAYKDIVEAQNVTQYHAGIVYNIPVFAGFSIQPGVVYNMKGAALSQQISSISGITGFDELSFDIETSTGYLEVPLRIQYTSGEGLLAPFVFVEPFVGYAITTETVSKFKNTLEEEAFKALAASQGYELNTSSDSENKWDGRDRLQYGVGVGVGILLFDKLALSAKYYWEMGNMFTEDGQSSWSAQRMYDTVKTTSCNGISASVTLYF